MKKHGILFIIVISLLPFLCHSQEYKNLVLKGGGIRGLAYPGAFKVLEEKNITIGIEKVAGTSVGAIAGTLFCLGYTASQMETIILDMDVATFKDGEWFFIGGQKRIRKNYGWYKGKRMEEWMGRQIKGQTGSENTTFMQLHQLALTNKKFKDPYIAATNLTKQTLEIFSWETYPDMPIKTAVRASAAIPVFYGAVFIDSSGNIVEHPKKNEHYNVYVDGGLLANYPIKVFNTQHDNNTNIINKNTLGLKLERPDQIEFYKEQQGIAPYDIHSFYGYMSALYNVTMEQLSRGITYNEEKKHTIYISTSNLSPVVRNISPETKELLFKNGEDAARIFFDAKTKQAQRP